MIRSPAPLPYPVLSLFFLSVDLLIMEALHKQDLEPDIVDMTAMLDIWDLFPLQFLVMELGFDLDGPDQARTVARVQKWPRRSVQARAMVARVELRVELVRQGKSSNNDMVRADGGSRVPDIDGSSSSSSFLATTS
ncbi:hypothetical protein DKX38_003693 [Salix brachista]|uniref:Uncharacterized protein n=1 Tax=Salix brachista TaxID=2182728 RepID=A0A5N5N914_9ROSI|nr:hypothetical protein DKX38_003693 [Salix brachista]